MVGLPSCSLWGLPRKKSALVLGPPFSEASTAERHANRGVQHSRFCRGAFSGSLVGLSCCEPVVPCFYHNCD